MNVTNDNLVWQAPPNSKIAYFQWPIELISEDEDNNDCGNVCDDDVEEKNAYYNDVDDHDDHGGDNDDDDDEGD